MAADDNKTLTNIPEEFFSESQEIVDKFNHDVLEFDDESRKGISHPDLINDIFRSAHSLKGLASMFGVSKLADFAHKLENLLDGLRMGRVAHSPAIINVLLESVDLFNQLIIEASGGPVVAELELKNMQKKIDEAIMARTGGQPEENPLDTIDIDPNILNALTEYEEYRLCENIRQGANLYLVYASFDLFTFDESLESLTTDIKSVGEVISTLPGSDSSNEQRINFDIIVSTSFTEVNLAKQLSAHKVSLKVVQRRQVSVQKKQKVVSAAPLEQPLEPSTLAEEKTPELPGVEPAKVEEKDEEQIDISLRSVSQTVRVDIKKLNDLMNVVGELVLVRSAMQVISEKLKEIQGFSSVATEFFKETRNFNRKLEQLQTGIMNVRMVPLGQNFEKLSRMVRRISHSLNKEVDLKTSGADTEVDKLIVEDLADPLMHILRNAIDHGIEDVSVREAHGKPRVGLITMDAYTKGSHVIIKIRDDGQGIDLEKIRTSALKKEVVSPDRISELSDKDLLNLLFLPGFSTSEQVSEISGRGVGLDVVKTNIAAMSGMIDIESKFDVGTCLTITLPITLAIMQALIVQVKNHIYAIPLSSVVEIITLEISDIRTIEQREMCELRGVTVPLVRLERLFDLQGVNAEEDQNIIYAVLVGLAENRVGIVVDELRGQEDIVIKSMGKSLIHASGIAGAANLANQQTILVLDVASLINEALSYV